MRRVNWFAVLIGIGFFICVGFMAWNLELWSANPGRHGDSLFAAVWCGVMALITLFNFHRVL